MERQIKNNAHKAAIKLNHGEPDIYRKGYEEGYIAGAHSRDEEVELLKKKLKIYLEKEEEEKQKAWAESWGKDDWGFR